MSAVQVEQLLAGLIDSSGQPLSGGKVHTYEAGTTTPKTTYQDLAQTIPHTNPIILNAMGQALVFADGAFKFDIDDASDVDVAEWDDLVFQQEGDNLVWAGNTTGSSNAYVLTPSTPLTAYSAGQRVMAISNFANTGACTANISNLGAKNIKLTSGNDPLSGQIQNSQLMDMIYDGTSLILLNPYTGSIAYSATPGANSGTWAPTVTSNYRIDPSGDWVTVEYSATAATPSASANYLTLSLPVPAANTFHQSGCYVDVGTAEEVGHYLIHTSGLSQVRIYRGNYAAFSNSSTTSTIGSLTYRVS